jgi:hypothetical protein
VGDRKLNGEGQQIVPATGEQRQGQRFDKAVTLVWVEQVKKPRIHNRSKLPL